MNSEIHLFILWEHARSQESAILEDIQKHFHLLAYYEMRWSPTTFSENLSRFYGQRLPSGSQKEKQCGRGPFTVLIVQDLQPTYEDRQTSAATEYVNINMFDAKERYRQRTGGGHRVHGTNSLEESRHDLSLLLGKTPEDFAHQQPLPRETLERDLEGAHGWSSLTHLFRILNQTARYVVLRNFEGFPGQYTLENHGDIDVLTENYQEVAFITNAEKVFQKSYRRHYTVNIDSKPVPFDFRDCGDGYFDTNWQKLILTERELANDSFYRPSDPQYFYSLLYHALVHKKSFSSEYQQRLQQLSNTLEQDLDLSSTKAAQDTLESFLTSHGYHYTEPHDVSVYFNQNIARNTPISLPRKLNNIRRSLRERYHLYSGKSIT